MEDSPLCYHCYIQFEEIILQLNKLFDRQIINSINASSFEICNKCNSCLSKNNITTYKELNWKYFDFIIKKIIPEEVICKYFYNK